LKGSIKKVADFLNKSLTEEKLTKLTEHLRIDNFAKNDAVNYEVGKEMGFMKTSGRFIRKGDDLHIF
jgi:Sulfotransferase domain